MLTSGKASATDVAVTVSDNTHLTVSPNTVTSGASGAVITLAVAQPSQATHKLPAEISGVTVNGQALENTASGFTYDAERGVVTIASTVTIDGDIAIEVTALEMSDDTSLSSLTYSIPALGIKDV